MNLHRSDLYRIHFDRYLRFGTPIVLPIERKEWIFFGLSFAGIMLGIFFYMMNGLFGHVGLLQAWPPVAAAAVPSIAFLLLAVAMTVAWNASQGAAASASTPP